MIRLWHLSVHLTYWASSMMNHYLCLVDQLMRIRFQFRKSTSKIASHLIGPIKGQEAPAETPGRVYVVITMAHEYNQAPTNDIVCWRNRLSDHSNTARLA